jgi:nitroimidazol reductase NimA-like FMN-containing flavoprotein (pyridoxamine 5'-phosphate oxidase superfamily)
MVSSSAALPLPNLVGSRHRERLTDDAAIVRAILDEGMIAHIGFVRDGWPTVLPFHYGVGDIGDGLQMIIHGSTGGRAFLDAAASDAGVPVSVCVSINDGLVLGRSTYETGAHYRSVVAFGNARSVPAEARVAALDILMDHILPGRRAEVRESTAKEVAATAVLAIPLTHARAKTASTSTGETFDDGEDRAVWAGVIPLAMRAGSPVAAPETTHPNEVPPSVRAFIDRLNGR